MEMVKYVKNPPVLEIQILKHVITPHIVRTSIFCNVLYQ